LVTITGLVCENKFTFFRDIFRQRSVMGLVDVCVGGGGASQEKR